MKKVLDSIGSLAVELTAKGGDEYTDLYLEIKQIKDYLNATLDAPFYEMEQRIKPVLASFAEKKNCFNNGYVLLVRCYTDPQLERGYQAMLELWQAIKTAATTTPPRRIVAENKLKELFK